MAFDERMNAPYTQSYLVRPARRRRWLERLLLIGFLSCLLVGLVALALFWRITATRAPTIDPDDPLASLRARAIIPNLALAELAGDPADALAYQALAAGHLETARTLLTYTSGVDRTSHLGLLVQLAHLYVEAGEPRIAELLFHQALSIAILDNPLGGLERSQIIAQIAQGLMAAGAKDAARDAVLQSFRVARQAPGLLPAQRSQLFTSLRPLVDQLGDNGLRQQIAEFARNPFVEAPGDAPIAPDLWRLAEPLPIDPTLATAIATRQQRARELVNRIAFTAGADIDPEKTALAEALRAEDQARGLVVTNLQPSGLPPAQQLTLLLQQRDWLLLKLRIASLGFGLSLAPEWESDRSTLQRDLNALIGALDERLQSLIAMQSDPVEQALLRLEAQRWLALQRELGQYPNMAPDLLGRRLTEAQGELARLGHPLALPIAYDTAVTPAGFRIQATQ
jgi:hypothetical protein